MGRARQTVEVSIRRSSKDFNGHTCEQEKERFYADALSEVVAHQEIPPHLNLRLIALISLI